KRGRHVPDRFARKPLPLGGIYVLGQGESATIEDLDAQAALVSLIANSYMGRFGKELLQGAEASAHLRQCVQVISHVSVCRLERPGALSLLPAVAKLVEDHLQRTKLVSV
ncbi:MAG TPA: hypothetical protein VHP35_04555, partial [Terriglobia bacterium]|nr:hypothetical protein [Terriglobia bacterium]